VDDFLPFLIIIMFVAPLIERIIKGARGQQQQQRRPGQPQLPRPPQRIPPDATSTSTAETGESTAPRRDASDIIPGELWEILTGQKRSDPAPPPERVPAPAPPRPPPPRPTPTRLPTTVARRPPLRPPVEEDEEQIAAARRRHSYDVQTADEDSAASELMRRREKATEIARRVEHAAPVIVSLETEPLSEQRRHSAFHKRLDRLPEAAKVALPKTVGFEIDLRDRSAMRRAIVMKEVLGQPLGLEEPDRQH
jgi:hypothetical protein